MKFCMYVGMGKRFPKLITSKLGLLPGGRYGQNPTWLPSEMKISILTWDLMVGSYVIPFFMFSWVLISFLWSICNLELKLESYDHFKGKKAVRIHTIYAQLICSNATKQESPAIALYQHRERETPFPLYIPLKLHANSRQNEAIAIFHPLGVSVSYDRVMDVRRDFAKAVSMRWAADGVDIPTNAMRGCICDPHSG